MKIALGADHGGFELKKDISHFLSNRGYAILDCGTDSLESCDYPRFAAKVAERVSTQKVDLGILICKSGNGMAMVANKYPGVRAAICFDKNLAILSRQHNDANVLVLGSEHLLEEPQEIIRTWLGSAFEGGRHGRRVKLIDTIEKKLGLVQSPKKAKAIHKKGKKRK